MILRRSYDSKNKAIVVKVNFPEKLIHDWLKAFSCLISKTAKEIIVKLHYQLKYKEIFPLSCQPIFFIIGLVMVSVKEIVKFLQLKEGP